MAELVLLLSFVSTVFYLGSLITMRRYQTLPWWLTLAALTSAALQIYIVGAYPSLIGSALGIVIAIRNLRSL